jgi:hypothetical protein
MKSMTLKILFIYPFKTPQETAITMGFTCPNGSRLNANISQQVTVELNGSFFFLDWTRMGGTMIPDEMVTDLTMRIISASPSA